MYILGYSMDAQKVTNPIVFGNPLNNPLTMNLKTLGDMVVRHISSVLQDHCIISDGRHQVLHIPTQRNGTDCGYYVMQTFRLLVKEFILLIL